MWLYGYVAMWLYGYVAKRLSGGTGARVVGEPPAWRTLTDLCSELLEPQGKPGWGKIQDISWDFLGLFGYLDVSKDKNKWCREEGTCAKIPRS